MTVKRLIEYLIIINVLAQSISKIIRTTSGRVRGRTIKIYSKSVEQYLNIPYAEPPLGRLRFSKPLSLIKPIKSIIDGTRSGKACYTMDQRLTVPQSEDCLLLNIWTKNSSNSLKAVMVYSYGGALEMGTIYQKFLYGSVLATKGMVFVTVNYRLGALGWLYGGDESAPGNVGLYDQLLALHWVRNNINKFGGDPNQVTINGQSAGGWCASALIMSPLTKGLFSRAILESGVWFQNNKSPVLPKTLALSQAKDLAKSVNCLTNSWLDCLREVDPKIIYNYKNLTAYPIYGTEILPLSAQKAFLAQTYRKDIDLMVGTVRDEGSRFARLFYPKSDLLHSRQEFKDLVESVPLYRSLPFPNLNSEKITEFYLKNVNTTSTESLRNAFWAFYGDLRVTCSTYFFAKQFALHSPQRSVFFFYWTYTSRRIASKLGCTKDMGVCHAVEVRYLFGEPFLSLTSDLIDKYFSEYTMKLWTNFAKYGNPVESERINIWPRFIDNTNGNSVTKIKEINPFRPNHIINNLFDNNCERFWRNYFV